MSKERSKWRGILWIPLVITLGVICLSIHCAQAQDAEPEDSSPKGMLDPFDKPADDKAAEKLAKEEEAKRVAAAEKLAKEEEAKKAAEKKADELAAKKAQEEADRKAAAKKADKLAAKKAQEEADRKAAEKKADDLAAAVRERFVALKRSAIALREQVAAERAAVERRVAAELAAKKKADEPDAADPADDETGDSVDPIEGVPDAATKVKPPPAPGAEASAGEEYYSSSGQAKHTVRIDLNRGTGRPPVYQYLTIYRREACDHKHGPTVIDVHDPDLKSHLRRSLTRPAKRKLRFVPVPNNVN